MQITILYIKYKYIDYTVNTIHKIYIKLLYVKNTKTKTKQDK